jgi:hypothetical protein
MVISASGVTQLSEDIAQDRIKDIIDNDPRITSEIQARINQMRVATSIALKKIYAATHLTQQERDREAERKKRELAIYDQWDADPVFKERVNNALS